MEEKGRLKLLLAVLAAVTIFGGVIWWQYKHPARPRPEGPGVYYTGMMKGKGGHPVMADDNGNVKPLPENLRAGAAANKVQSP